MNRLLALTIIVGFCLMATSCGDDDSVAPVLTISTPISGSIYSAGDVVSVVGSATDDVGLKAINFTSEDLGLNESITNFVDPLNAPFTANITLNAATPAGSYVLSIEAVDTSDNTDVEEITLIVQ